MLSTELSKGWTPHTDPDDAEQLVGGRSLQLLEYPLNHPAA